MYKFYLIQLINIVFKKIKTKLHFLSSKQKLNRTAVLPQLQVAIGSGIEGKNSAG